MGLPKNGRSETALEPRACQTQDLAAEHTVRGESGSSRRDVIRQGVKLAFVAPLLSTFHPQAAYAGNYSCYPAGHVCPGAEPCCDSLACNDGVCGGPCADTGELCYSDPDCCSSDCDTGVCK